jgi:hypothetical protein
MQHNLRSGIFQRCGDAVFANPVYSHQIRVDSTFVKKKLDPVTDSTSGAENLLPLFLSAVGMWSDLDLLQDPVKIPDQKSGSD